MEDIKFDDDIIDYEEESIEEAKAEEAKAEEAKAEEAKADIKEYMLYMVTDRIHDGLLMYFRENGVNISNIYSRIEDVRDVILMQSEPCRLIVADTGLGKFINTRSRKELIDMLGICDDNNKITVFYTDNIIKHEYDKELKGSGLAIDWKKYVNTASIVASILSYNEKYKLDDMSDKEEISKESLSEIKGMTVNTVKSKADIKEYPSYLDSIAIDMLQRDDNIIEGYKIDI